MAKVSFPINICMIFLLITLSSSNVLPQASICLISDFDSPESKATQEFLHDHEITFTSFDKNDFLKNKDLRKDFTLIWFHFNDPTYANDFKDPRIADKLDTFLRFGGNVLMTLDAFPLIYELGFENQAPGMINKESIDNGFGRQLGMHALIGHPVFEGLNGGAYIYKPVRDTTVRVYGYYEENKPENSQVIAVDWDYIFLRENKRIMVEHKHGNGKIAAVGGYVNFLPENINRQHLEKFIKNIFSYLSGRTRVTEKHYWNLSDPDIKEFNYSVEKTGVKPGKKWKAGPDLPELSKENAEGDYWDVAGQRMLLMGSEKSGIEEMWAHPFMACRDLETGIRLIDSDTTIWLSNLTANITVFPNALIRQYELGDAKLKEITTTSVSRPAAVIHYEIENTNEAELLFRFKSNLRVMWPYSHKVMGDLTYSFSKDLNAFLITSGNGKYCSVIGSNGKIKTQVIGKFDSVELNKGSKQRSTERYLVSGGCAVYISDSNPVDFLICATPEGIDKTVGYYQELSQEPEKIYYDSGNYYKRFLNKTTQIISPDPVFNEAFQWAVLATDQFFVSTPGIGSSFTAGYATTHKGWDGNHEINGRPGYGWYFGRDAQWSGMATLHYGDFEKIRSTLETFIKFQDLNGKIFHELSTSGFVHYDAADATPLFIILAGRYLKHSGDLDFIKANWPSIKKAIDFCYSTDTDKDLLIENTNVGHGWVEGGFLFGSKTSLYLASCWSEALLYASYIAWSLGEDEKLWSEYDRNGKTVGQKIRSEFWNEETGFFNQGIYADGTFHQEPTILSSIPLLFGQAYTEQAESVAQNIAGYNYTSDWGCRIAGKESERYNPKGYHTGSVWPLYTGWASLGEYYYGHSIQGFTHLMNNLMVYKYWGLGYIEEVLNGDNYIPGGVCSHQCWSQTMAIQPAIEGMLGFTPNAMAKSIDLMPKLPPQWDSLEVKNLRCGDNLVSFTMNKTAGKINYLFTKGGPDDLEITFAPHYLPGTEIVSIKTNGSDETIFDTYKYPRYTAIYQLLDLKDTLSVEIGISGGISIFPLIPDPKPGDATKEPKIISHELLNNKYTVILEGLGGTSGTFDLWYNGYDLLEIQNCSVIEKKDGVAKIIVEFVGEGATIIRKNVSFKINSP